MAYKYVDLSVHNGKVDFLKLKNAVDGVILRAGWGWYHKDGRFEEYRKKCEKYNIPYGIYFFSYALNMDNAKKEITKFISHIKNYRPSLPVVIDEEDDGYRSDNGFPYWVTLSRMCLYQLKELEKAGFYAMWYASRSWYDNMVKNDSSLKNYDFWLAHWGAKEPTRTCGIWQYTNKGVIAGVNGRVDLNYAYKNYPKIMRENGLNNFKKENKGDKKVIKKEAKILIYPYGDGDIPTCEALSNVFPGIFYKRILREEDKNDFFVIRVGGPDNGDGNYIPGVDRLDTLKGSLEVLPHIINKYKG